MWRPAPRGTELAARPKPFGASVFDNWMKRRDAGATGHRTAPEPVLLSLEALRLLRSSRFALTQPDAFGAGESLGVLESGVGFNAGVLEAGALHQILHFLHFYTASLLHSLTHPIFGIIHTAAGRNVTAT